MLKRYLDELFTVTWQKKSDYFHLDFNVFFKNCCFLTGMKSYCQQHVANTVLCQFLYSDHLFFHLDFMLFLQLQCTDSDVAFYTSICMFLPALFC